MAWSARVRNLTIGLEMIKLKLSKKKVNEMKVVMKNLANKIVALFFILLIVFSFSCDNDDSSDGGIDIGIDPESPYNSPIWHPSGQFIGFNHTPLKRITYPDDGENWGHQEFEYDSTGFWLINPDGTNMRRIFPHTLHTPSWSPDGEWIAFVSDGQIFKMRYTGEKFDTTTITQLTSAGRNFFPDWSPDGQWIVHDRTYSYPETADVQGIWLLKSLDGSERIKISTGRMPDWATEGNEIIFIDWFDSIQGGIIKYNIQTGNRTLLFDGQGKDIRHAKYSHDGTKVAFTTSPSLTGTNIWIMNINGSDFYQLTSDGVDVDYGLPFSWSPEGKKIVYTQYQSTDWTMNNGVLWMIDVDSGTETQLTFN